MYVEALIAHNGFFDEKVHDTINFAVELFYLM